jgi:hypothetical protein
MGGGCFNAVLSASSFGSFSGGGFSGGGVTAGLEATADSVVPEVEAWLTFRLARRRMSLCLAKVAFFWDGVS